MNQTNCAEPDPPDPIALLMDEHRLIERALDCLQSFLENLSPNASPADLATLLEFFKSFADQTHHHKEEHLLFQALVASGFTTDLGPIAVMNQEHNVARQTLAALSALPATWSPTDLESLRTHATAYLRLLHRHILKEDQILYPMALTHLSESVLDDLGEKFTALDLSNQAPLAALRKKLESLEKTYSKPKDRSLVANGVLPHGDSCQQLCNRYDCAMLDSYDEENPWNEID